MKILIIGTGNVGTAMAADLSLKGNEVVMLKTTLHLEVEHCDKITRSGIAYLDLDGKKHANIKEITTSYEEAFKFEPDVVIVAVQTNYQEEIIKSMSNYLNKNQIVMFVPGYLATAILLKYCKDNMPVVVEAESSAIDCRITSPGEVTVLFKNVRNPIGVFPVSKTKEVLDKLSCFGYNYTDAGSIVAAALHNPNLIVHTVGAIMSIPRIEYSNGNYWMYKEVFTPSIWNLVEALDMEKMNIMDKLGLEKIPYVEACKIRNSTDLSTDAKEVFFDYAMNHSPKGPNVSNSRYVTEDVPQGLVMLESLGKMLDINTDVCTSLINIASACLNTNFRDNGRTVERLGSENLLSVLDDNS